MSNDKTIELAATEITFRIPPNGERITVDIIQETIRIERMSTGRKPEDYIPLLQKELTELHKIEFSYGVTSNYVLAIQQAFTEVKKKLGESLASVFGTVATPSPSQIHNTRSS